MILFWRSFKFNGDLLQLIKIMYSGETRPVGQQRSTTMGTWSVFDYVPMDPYWHGIRSGSSFG